MFSKIISNSATKKIFSECVQLRPYSSTTTTEKSQLVSALLKKELEAHPEKNHLLNTIQEVKNMDAKLKATILSDRAEELFHTGFPALAERYFAIANRYFPCSAYSESASLAGRVALNECSQF